jgi:hypothetical protein
VRAAIQAQDKIVDHIFGDASAFTGTPKQYDDMTLLMMKLPSVSNVGKS